MSLADEEALIRAFVVASRRARYLDLVASKKRRPKFLFRLAHFADLDPRFATRLHGVETSDHAVIARLKKLGAPDECYVISESSALDSLRMPLDEAVSKVVIYDMSSFVSSVPGRLAFLRNEDGYWICQR